MLIKTPLLHQSSGPRVFLSLSLSPSLSFSGWSPGAQRLSEFTFLPGLLRPSREGALHLHPIEGAWGLREQSKPRAGALLAFCINQGISASFSLLYFPVGRLRTTRFRSIKGPQPVFKMWCIFFLHLQNTSLQTNHISSAHVAGSYGVSTASELPLPTARITPKQCLIPGRVSEMHVQWNQKRT